jgi:hypothetical protein
MHPEAVGPAVSGCIFLHGLAYLQFLNKFENPNFVTI